MAVGCQGGEEPGSRGMVTPDKQSTAGANRQGAPPTLLLPGSADRCRATASDRSGALVGTRSGPATRALRQGVRPVQGSVR